jgi:uncharacterized iron-regulated membrane protein
MKALRKIIFWCHLLTGVTAGLIILSMSVTGVLLAYERQITAWADMRDYRTAPPSAGATHLPIETLLAGVREARPDITPTAITLRADPTAPAAIGLTGGRSIFVNPYTGEVLGEGSKKVRDFFRAITDWHRWLGAQGASRATTRAITGACNLGFLFLVMSGFYMWWPRTWRWPQVRNVIWFKRGLAGRARDFNWHNVIGFWVVIPLFIVVLSAVVISYTWAGNLVYRLVGETPPAPRAAPAQPAGNTTGAPPDIPLDGLNRLWSLAEQQTTGWQSISLRLPSPADESVTFTIDRGDGGQPQKRSQLALDRKTSEVVRWEPFSSYTPGRKLRSILRFAHTGEVAGIIGQTVAGLASAGGALLVVTGLALALRRLRAWRMRLRQGETVPAISPLAEERVRQQT